MLNEVTNNSNKSTNQLNPELAELIDNLFKKLKLDFNEKASQQTIDIQIGLHYDSISNDLSIFSTKNPAYFSANREIILPYILESFDRNFENATPRFLDVRMNAIKSLFERADIKIDDNTIESLNNDFKTIMAKTDDIHRKDELRSFKEKFKSLIIKSCKKESEYTEGLINKVNIDDKKEINRDNKQKIIDLIQKIFSPNLEILTESSSQFKDIKEKYPEIFITYHKDFIDEVKAQLESIDLREDQILFSSTKIDAIKTLFDCLDLEINEELNDFFKDFQACENPESKQKILDKLFNHIDELLIFKKTSNWLNLEDSSNIGGVLDVKNEATNWLDFEDSVYKTNSKEIRFSVEASQDLSDKLLNDKLIMEAEIKKLRMQLECKDKEIHGYKVQNKTLEENFSLESERAGRKMETLLAQNDEYLSRNSYLERHLDEIKIKSQELIEANRVLNKENEEKDTLLIKQEKQINDLTTIIEQTETKISNIEAFFQFKDKQDSATEAQIGNIQVLLNEFEAKQDVITQKLTDYVAEINSQKSLLKILLDESEAKNSEIDQELQVKNKIITELNDKIAKLSDSFVGFSKTVLSLNQPHFDEQSAKIDDLEKYLQELDKNIHDISILLAKKEETITKQAENIIVKDKEILVLKEMHEKREVDSVANDVLGIIKDEQFKQLLLEIKNLREELCKAHEKLDSLKGPHESTVDALSDLRFMTEDPNADGADKKTQGKVSERVNFFESLSNKAEPSFLGGEASVNNNVMDPSSSPVSSSLGRTTGVFSFLRGLGGN